jgi:hypothetical protein
MMQIENLLGVKHEFDIEGDRYILILGILMNFIDLRMNSGVKIEHRLFHNGMIFCND